MRYTGNGKWTFRSPGPLSTLEINNKLLHSLENNTYWKKINVINKIKIIQQINKELKVFKYAKQGRNTVTMQQIVLAYLKRAALRHWPDLLQNKLLLKKKCNKIKNYLLRIIGRKADCILLRRVLRLKM